LRNAISNLKDVGVGNIDRIFPTLIEATDAAENSCRKRMQDFHNQQMSILEDVLCRGEDPSEHKYVIKAKYDEFVGLKISEIKLSSISHSGKQVKDILQNSAANDGLVVSKKQSLFSRHPGSTLLSDTGSDTFCKQTRNFPWIHQIDFTRFSGNRLVAGTKVEDSACQPLLPWRI
jgi:hypothetical protein